MSEFVQHSMATSGEVQTGSSGMSEAELRDAEAHGLSLSLDEQRVTARKLLDNGEPVEKVAQTVKLPVDIINRFVESGIINEPKGYFQRGRETPTTQLYVIGCDDHGVKIGVSKDPEARRADLQTGCPIQLEILNTIGTEEAERIERVLHKKYREYRTTGEWFDLPQAELERLVYAETPSEVDYER